MSISAVSSMSFSAKQLRQPYVMEWIKKAQLIELNQWKNLPGLGLLAGRSEEGIPKF